MNNNVQPGEAIDSPDHASDRDDTELDDERDRRVHRTEFHEILVEMIADAGSQGCGWPALTRANDRPQ